MGRFKYVLLITYIGGDILWFRLNLYVFFVKLAGRRFAILRGNCFGRQRVPFTFVRLVSILFTNGFGFILNFHIVDSKHFLS